MCVKEIDGTFYIDMNSVTGRKFFITEIIQKFGLYRTINKVVLYYSGTTAYSPKIFIRDKFIKHLEGKLKNFACVIELLDMPDICDEILFKPISYTNNNKPWDSLDEHDIFDYVFLNYDRPTLKCKRMVDNYIKYNGIDDCEPIKNESENSTSETIARSELIKELKKNPNKFPAGINIRTDSGWKNVQDIIVGDKLLVMGKFKNDIVYQDVTSIRKKCHPYGIDTFKFKSSSLDVELLVGFKSDFALKCKPAHIGVIMKAVDISLKSCYKNSTTIDKIMKLRAKNSQDAIRIIIGVFVLCGRLCYGGETVELRFKLNDELNELMQLLTEYKFNYGTKQIDNNMIISIKSRRLYKEINLILDNTMKGNKKLFINGKNVSCAKYKAYLLKGMLLYSKMVGKFGKFETINLDIAELIQELIIHAENKIVQIKKSGRCFKLDYSDCIDNDIIIKSNEYRTAKFIGSTYEVNINEENVYTLVLARDKNGRAFWIGI